jgi:hypothetical protein
MGVDCVVWVIPKERLFRPSVEQFADLANALRDNGWVPKPDAPGQRSEVRELLPSNDVIKRKPAMASEIGPEQFTASWVEFHSKHELVLQWYVNDMALAGVQFPFVFLPYPDSGHTYFCIRLILGRDYFYYTGENVMPFEVSATQCSCSEQFVYETGWSPGVPYQRIHSFCPKCGRSFNPSSVACNILDGWTGASSSLIGGLTFRFALVVDCHKNWPHEEEAGRQYHLRAQFLDLWRKFIGVPFEQVVTFD